MIQSLTRSIARRRGRWAAILVLLGTLSLWPASRLSLRLDLADFLPTHATNDKLETILGELGDRGRIAVFLESDRVMDSQEAGPILQRLARRLERVEGIRAVRYRLSPEMMRFLEDLAPKYLLIYADPGDLQASSANLTRQAIRNALGVSGAEGANSSDDREAPKTLRALKDPLGVIGLASRTVNRRIGTSRVRITDGYFSVSNGRKFFLTLETESDLTEIGRARQAVAGIERVLDEARSNGDMATALQGKSMYAVGRPVSYVYAFRTILEDIGRISVAATLAVIVLLMFFFRRPLAPLLLILPIAYGLILTAGVAVLLFQSVSLVAWIFIAVLVGLGVDFGIHISVHYWIYGAVDVPPRTAVESAVMRPGRGILFGGLTSAGAFLMLQVVSYPVLTQVAWLTALGLLAILASTFILLPLTLSGSTPGRRTETLWHTWARTFERAHRAPPLVVLVPWTGLVLLTLLAVRDVRLETHPWKLALRGNPKSAELERLNRELGTAFTPLLMVSPGATLEQAVARDREAVQRLGRRATASGVASIESLSRWLPPPEDQRANLRYVREHPKLFAPNRLRRDFLEAVAELPDPDPYLTDEYLPLILRSLGSRPDELGLEDLRAVGLSEVIDRHRVTHNGEHLAISYIYLRRFPWAEGAVTRFLEGVDASGALEVPGVEIVGDALRSASHPTILRRDATVATALAFALVAAILYAQFGSLLSVGLCVLPLVAALCATLTLMGLLDIELNLLTLSIAPVLVGISVDDGIHMVERLQRGTEIGTALRETGSSMTLTTATSAAAFACLGFASFQGVRELGFVGAAGLFVALLASLHLIPFCWQVLHLDETVRERDPA